MTRSAIAGLVLLAPMAMAAPAAEPDAKALAHEILTKGAALFDRRDAAALADTYIEDAELTLIGKDQDTGGYKAQETRGRTAIERFYQDLFKDRPAGAKSKNEVEHARLVAPDLLVIQGRFTPDVDRDEPIPFVQIRAKKGDQWLIVSLQLILTSR